MNKLDNRKMEYEEVFRELNLEGTEEYHFDEENLNIAYIAYTEDELEERFSTSNIYLDVEDNKIHFNYNNGVLNFNFSFEATKEILKDFLGLDFDFLISLLYFVDFKNVNEGKLEEYTQKYIEQQVSMSDIETELKNTCCGFINIEISEKCLDFL